MRSTTRESEEVIDVATNELAQVPTLGGEYALTAEQVQDFRRDGHVLLRGVVSPAEMAAYRPPLAGSGMQLANYGAMAAGDASFHTGWTLHGTRQNTSPRTREALVIVYYADGARVETPPAPANALPQEQFAATIRQHNLSTCLPGLKPGDRAETFMNPIVYGR